MNIHRSLILKKETKAWQQNLPNLSVKRDQRQTFLAVHPIWGLIPMEVYHPPATWWEPEFFHLVRLEPAAASGQVQSDSYLCSDFCSCAALICVRCHMQPCTSNTPCCQVNLRHSMRNSSREKVRILQHLAKREMGGEGITSESSFF